MTFLGGLMQDVIDAALCTQRRILRNAQALGNLVGREKADPEDIHGQPIRVFPDHLERGLAVVFENARGISRTHPMPTQEDHELPDVLLVFPGSGDLSKAIGADAVDLQQSFGVVVDDLERLGAETADNPLGHDRTDSFDQARTEIFADALY